MKNLFIISASSLLLFSCNNHTTESDCASRVTTLEQQVTMLKDSIQKLQTPTAVLVDSSANTTETASSKTMYKAGKNRVVGADGRHVGGWFPEGSERRLTVKDLDNLSLWGLKLIENEIYARHGMGFKDAELKEHFAGQRWYHNQNANVANKLTPIERDNVILIKSYKYVPTIQ